MDLSKILSKERQTQRNTFVILAAIVFATLCAFLLNRIERKFVLAIDSFELNKTTLTVGNNSDIAIKSVPHDYMKVIYNDNEHNFEWTIDRSRDSLCYFQINGKNPNTHIISSSSKVKISGFAEKNTTTEIDGNSIIKCVQKYEDTQYFLLRNVLSINGDTTCQSLEKYKNIASLVYKKDDVVSIVILDPYTSIDGMEYAYHGMTRDLTPNRQDLFKVQFYAVRDFFVKYDQVDKKMFHIGDLNYIVKPILQTTEWGAGHILLTPTGNNKMKVRFPKSIMYVEDLHVLKDMANSHSGLITLKQQSNMLPLSDNIYLPLFSSGLNYDICNFDMAGKNTYLLSNSDDSIVVNSKLCMVPTFDRTELTTGINKIDIRYGLLDWKYIFSIMILPLLMLVLIIATHLLLMRKKQIRQIKKASNQSMLYSSYFVAIASIAFVYCMGKIMIALKLSYTYPYFEKLTGIISVSTSLMLLLFYLISLLLNIDFIIDTVKRPLNSIAKLRLFTPCLTGILGLLLCMYGLKSLDEGINLGAKTSYFADEWFTFRIDKWMDLAGINDTHRSVVYILLLACLIVSTLLLLQVWISCSKKRININFVEKIDKWTILKLRWDDSSHNNWKSIVLYVVTYLINNVLIVALLLFLIGFIPGNFTTAFITVISVWGLARALTNIDPKEGAVANILEMILSSIIIIIVAFIPDHGYLTNYFGFIAAVLMFYMLMQKSNLSVALSKEERKRKEREIKWIPRIGLIVAIFLFLTPFIYNKYNNPEKVDYNRSSRRFMLASQFEQYHKSGYRYADSDVEFMKILYHYMGNRDGGDPLSNEKHQLHPSISTGQSPVILNDVSLPSSFFGAYGKGAYFVYFGLILLLFYVVTTYTLTGSADKIAVPFDRYSQWRLLAMLMWIGTTLYLFLSYCGVLPFTGRLNPGYGVDAVGEALESAFLLAFMTATKTKNN